MILLLKSSINGNQQLMKSPILSLYSVYFLIASNESNNALMYSEFNNWSKKSVRPAYKLRDLGVRHIQNKNYKNLKNSKAIRVHQNKGWKPILILGFFKTLVTQNLNLSFTKGFFLRQAVNCSLKLFENSYDQKCIF